MNALFHIQGKTAIVTGGSRGIGAMIAQGLVANGVKTYITARSSDECQTTARRLSQYGECIAIPANLSSMTGIKIFAEQFGACEDKLDILVNNAGTNLSKPIEDYTESDWDDVLTINLKSVFFLTQHLLNKLKRETRDDPARIVNIASIGGMIVSPLEHYAYTSSKAGLIHLTRHLAMGLANHNITVNAISPGVFPSQMTGGWLHGHEEQAAQYTALGRIGRPEDIVGAVVYLASLAGAWITGINVPVDGGSSVKRY